MAVLDDRVEAIRAKDIDQLMSLYSPDIEYFGKLPAPTRGASQQDPG